MLPRDNYELLLFSANLAIFQLYHHENNLIFNEIMMISALYSTNMLSWIFSADRHIAPPRPIIQNLSQPVFALSP